MYKPCPPAMGFFWVTVVRSGCVEGKNHVALAETWSWPRAAEGIGGLFSSRPLRRLDASCGARFPSDSGMQRR